MDQIPALHSGLLAHLMIEFVQNEDFMKQYFISDHLISPCAVLTFDCLAEVSILLRMAFNCGQSDKQHTQFQKDAEPLPPRT